MSIILTEKAASEVKRIIEEQKLGAETVLRVGVAGGGCSGFQYSLGFDKAYDEKTDSKAEFHGVTWSSIRRARSTSMVRPSTSTMAWRSVALRSTIRRQPAVADAAARSRPRPPLRITHHPLSDPRFSPERRVVLCADQFRSIASERGGNLRLPTPAFAQGIVHDAACWPAPRVQLYHAFRRHLAHGLQRSIVESAGVGCDQQVFEPQQRAVER